MIVAVIVTLFHVFPCKFFTPQYRPPKIHISLALVVSCKMSHSVHVKKVKGVLTFNLSNNIGILLLLHPKHSKISIEKEQLPVTLFPRVGLGTQDLVWTLNIQKHPCSWINTCFALGSTGPNSWATINTEGAWAFFTGRPLPWSQCEYGPIKTMQKLLLNASMSDQNNVTTHSQNHHVCFSGVCPFRVQGLFVAVEIKGCGERQAVWSRDVSPSVKASVTMLNASITREPAAEEKGGKSRTGKRLVTVCSMPIPEACSWFDSAQPFKSSLFSVLRKSPVWPASCFTFLWWRFGQIRNHKQIGTVMAWPWDHNK